MLQQVRCCACDNWKQALQALTWFRGTNCCSIEIQARRDLLMLYPRVKPLAWSTLVNTAARLT
jgi:hypothetical protein